MCNTNQDGVIRLKNGLEIVFREVPNSHVATLLVAVNAGSIYETEQSRGLAYLTSKCLFQESVNYKNIQKYIDSFGVRFSSDLEPDFCRYTFTFGEPFLDSLVTMVSNVLQNPLIKDDLVAETKNKLKLESFHKQENPQEYVEKYFLKNAFHVHPYKYFPVPESDTIEKLAKSDIVDFIKQLYVPSNIKIIITGPPKSKRAIPQLQKLLNSWEKKPSKTYTWSDEPQQEKPRKITDYHSLDMNFAFVAIGWKAPSILNQDTYVMDIIVSAMGLGESSRLNKQIRNKIPSVYYIWADYQTPREPGYFVIYAICDPNDADLVAQKIKKEIDILKTDSMTSLERERAYTILRTNEAFNWEHTTNTAQYIGYWTIMKDYSFALSYIDNLNAVTSDDVQRVAQKYFDDKNSTSIILLPENKEN